VSDAGCDFRIVRIVGFHPDRECGGFDTDGASSLRGDMGRVAESRTGQAFPRSNLLPAIDARRGPEFDPGCPSVHVPQMRERIMRV